MRMRICVTLIDCLVLVYFVLCIDILMQAAWKGLAEGKKQNAEGFRSVQENTRTAASLSAPRTAPVTAGWLTHEISSH